MVIRECKRGNKRGQVTLFVIISILLIVAVVLYFVLSGSLSKKIQIPNEASAVENSFLNCLEENIQLGILLLEENGGYISDQPYESSSGYAPFSSHLNFQGNFIPYWYYISGSSIPRENVPTKETMEKELASYIEKKSTSCGLENYNQNGFYTSPGKSKAEVIINDGNVEVNLNMDLQISNEISTYYVKEHKVTVNSKLGELYNSALVVYNKEQSELFLENYAVDTMRLYAPVDGVELSCSPKIWNAPNVFGDLKEAIEINTMALKGKGNSKDYFVVNSGISDDVRFITSRNWSSRYEVNPTDGALMISKPVGNQEGLGVLGFCYVPYHFVYNIMYPVLVQVYSGEEMFQFPVVVVIEGNKPRKSLDVTAESFEQLDICNYRNSLTEITAFDDNLNPLSVNVSFQCMGARCDVGQTENSNGSLITLLPQCHNGILYASSNNYHDERMTYSSVENGSVIFILDRTYDKEVNLYLGGKDYSGSAIISFSNSDGSTQTISYPLSKKVLLTPGNYHIEVYSYKDSSIKFGSTTKQQCIDTLQSGLLGFFGATEKKCYDINIPEQTITSVISGGGNTDYYFSSSDLSSSRKINIYAEEFPTPETIDDLQTTYSLLDTKSIEVNFG
jgi:hypothetical protein